MKKYNIIVMKDTIDEIYNAYYNHGEFSITYEFPEDDIEIDLAVCKGSHNSWIELIIFRCGGEECCLNCEIETREGIIGEWEFTDHGYLVVVEGEK